MAIFEPGSLIGAISGNVGGASFANRSGSKVVRKPRRPSRTNAERIINQQTLITNIARQWRDLTELERAAWRTAAANRPIPNRLGVSRAISGYQYYVSVNVTTSKDDPPLPTGFDSVVIVDFDSSVASGIDVNFTNLPGATVYAGYVYGRLFYKDYAPSFNNTWTKLGLVTTLGTVTVNIDTQWQTAFPLPILSQAIALDFRPFQSSTFIGGNTQQIVLTTA